MLTGYLKIAQNLPGQMGQSKYPQSGNWLKLSILTADIQIGVFPRLLKWWKRWSFYAWECEGVM